jgi:hypothetical protein
MNVLKGAEQHKTFERETPMGRMAMVDEAPARARDMKCDMDGTKSEATLMSRDGVPLDADV